MNCEQARKIALIDLVEKMGRSVEKSNGKEAWSKSPFRDEKTASLHIDLKKNLWFDFGAGHGGGPIELTIAYLKSTGEDHTVHDALRWMRNMTGSAVVPRPFRNTDVVDSANSETGWKIISVNDVENLALFRYMEKRGIPNEVTASHLVEVRVLSKQTSKKMFALGFKNDEGGYELRNPFLKSCIAPKAITFIRGNGKAVHIFEGLTDWLSILAQRENKSLDEDVIVLNSLSNLHQAYGYITNYPYSHVYTWMDNDEAGHNATKLWKEFCKTQSNLCHVSMNKQYAPHKDVNAAHMFELGLK